MTLEANMNDIDGKPCWFCGEPIEVEKGYTVAPTENGEQAVYHHTEARKCYEQKARGERPETGPIH